MSAGANLEFHCCGKEIEKTTTRSAGEFFLEEKGKDEIFVL
jgi:hypothetical protein